MRAARRRGELRRTRTTRDVLNPDDDEDPDTVDEAIELGAARALEAEKSTLRTQGSRGDRVLLRVGSRGRTPYGEGR